MALEGKELEGNIGKVGHYEADLDDKGMLNVSVGVQVDLYAEVEKLVLKTETKVDDAFWNVLKKVTNRA